jgi:hypothetical protein
VVAFGEELMSHLVRSEHGTLLYQGDLHLANECPLPATNPTTRPPGQGGWGCDPPIPDVMSLQIAGLAECLAPCNGVRFVTYTPAEHGLPGYKWKVAWVADETEYTVGIEWRSLPRQRAVWEIVALAEPPDGYGVKKTWQNRHAYPGPDRCSPWLLTYPELQPYGCIEYDPCLGTCAASAGATAQCLTPPGY